MPRRFTRAVSQIALVILVFAGSAAAFDGNRKGFVLGGGLGIAPYVHWEITNAGPLNVGEEKAGPAAHIIIGGAFSEHNMLVFESNIAAISSGYDDDGIGQGFSGGAWYHYFSAPGRTFFSVAGLGLYYFGKGEDDANDGGLAVLLGGGYEFSRHWQVCLYGSFGKSESSIESIKFEHNTLSVIVSGIAF